jgi:D-3-phosphoglycerate dehydrogenase
VKIAVLDDYQDAVRELSCFALLAGHEVTVFTEAAGPERLRDFDALVLNRERTRITAELVEELPRLRLISQTGRAGGHVDVAACTAAGVAVAEGVGSPVAPAELTWALVLAAARRLPQYAEALRTGRWQAADGGLGHVLHGRTLGIFGYGRIGSRVAGYGRAFGMQVLVWGRERSLAAAAADGFEPAPSQAALFERADVLTLHLRLTAETTGIVRLDDLRRLGPAALFVNTARAELVEPGALAIALGAGRPGAAAVDVFENEPAIADPLLRLPNVVATPHIGYVERDSYELYFEAAFRNVLEFEAGSYANVLNRDALQLG